MIVAHVRQVKIRPGWEGIHVWVINALLIRNSPCLDGDLIPVFVIEEGDDGMIRDIGQEFFEIAGR